MPAPCRSTGRRMRIPQIVSLRISRVDLQARRIAAQRDGDRGSAGLSPGGLCSAARAYRGVVQLGLCKSRSLGAWFAGNAGGPAKTGGKVSFRRDDAIRAAYLRNEVQLEN